MHRYMKNRSCQDRRTKPTPLFSRYTLIGRRTAFRRAEDQCRGGYVDRYGLQLLICLLLIAGLNILDAFFTITILENGGKEINPLIRWALDTYGHTAWMLKFVVVTCGLIIMCLHSHFRMVRLSIIIAIILYSGTVMYQIMLLRYLYM